MSDDAAILVPIRYPLTKEGKRTLAHAGDLSRERDADLYVLHINLFQTGANVHRADVERAIRPVMNGLEPTVVIRHGILIEELVLDEATYLGADVIVVGRNQKPLWRRLLSRAVGNDPSLPTYLREHAEAEVRVTGHP